MEIKRFYLGCLAHASYLVHDDGEAAVIDPQRDIDLYIEAARELGAQIRWVIETHLHADFVSGHLELASRAGATICIGAAAGALYEHRDLHDGDELPLGKATLRAISTPGHTEEGICILALGPGAEIPTAVFTGDTLFIGDVGRPDLSPSKTPQQLAGLLFDSLHEKLLTLPDETLVYPAHGAGSLCGKQMSSDSSSTIGKERRFNYALQAKSREEFITLLTAEMPPRPEYFQSEVARNRSGAAPLESLPAVRRLSPEEVLQLQVSGAIVLDTRPAEQFGAAHVPGSIHIALSGQFASWAARLLGIDATMVLVGENEEAVQEAQVRLARVGIEKIAGSLAGGILAWIASGKPVDTVEQISVHDLAEVLNSYADNIALIDVREASERASGRFIPESISIPLPELQARMDEIDRNSRVLVMCRSGYRSSVASSLLQAGGVRDVVNLVGGYDAWSLTYPSEAKVAELTM